MARADGMLGVAGHQVTNPVTRDLLRQKTRGEITSREYMVRVAEHTLGYVPASMGAGSRLTWPASETFRSPPQANGKSHPVSVLSDL